MRPRDRQLAAQLDGKLRRFAGEVVPLPGIGEPITREVFIEQLLESIHRVLYPVVLRGRPLSDLRTDPSSPLFDPIKAAIIQARRGDHDEACWLVFLFVLLGKHAASGYQLARDVYGARSGPLWWTWHAVSRNVGEFRTWLAQSADAIRGNGGKFGNHRKYESLNGLSAMGAGATVEGYVRWIGPPRTHAEYFQSAIDQARGDSRRAFAILYQSMDSVVRFGRLARLDYLAMVGKLDLATIEADRAYLSGATGPLSGARRLFGASPTTDLAPAELEGRLAELDSRLGVVMQVLEDALCNWNKSHTRLVRFRS